MYYYYDLWLYEPCSWIEAYSVFSVLGDHPPSHPDWFTNVSWPAGQSGFLTHKVLLTALMWICHIRNIHTKNADLLAVIGILGRIIETSIWFTFISTTRRSYFNSHTNHYTSVVKKTTNFDANVCFLNILSFFKKKIHVYPKNMAHFCNAAWMLNIVYCIFSTDKADHSSPNGVSQNYYNRKLSDVFIWKSKRQIIHTPIKQTKKKNNCCIVWG